MKIDRRTLIAGGASLTAASFLGQGAWAGEVPAAEVPREAVIVVAQLKAKAGEEEAVRKALLAMVEPTRKEEGCLCYNLHASKSDKSQFMFYEQWASGAALGAHVKTPHMKAMQEATDGRIATGGAVMYELLV